MFAKAAAKQTTSLPLDKKGVKTEPDNKTPASNIESENSPGKENRINVKIENEEKTHTKDEVKQNEKNISEKIQKLDDEKCLSIKKTSPKNARDSKKRENNSKKNDNKAKRRKRIQVRKSIYKIDIVFSSFWDIFKFILKNFPPPILELCL